MHRLNHTIFYYVSESHTSTLLRARKVVCLACVFQSKKINEPVSHHIIHDGAGVKNDTFLQFVDAITLFQFSITLFQYKKITGQAVMGCFQASRLLHIKSHKAYIRPLTTYFCHQTTERLPSCFLLAVPQKPHSLLSAAC